MRQAAQDIVSKHWKIVHILNESLHNQIYIIAEKVVENGSFAEKA